MLPPIQLFQVPRFRVRSCQKRNLNLAPKSIFRSPNYRSSPPYNHIVQIGDPVLRVPCDPLDPADIRSKEVKEIIKAMKFALHRFDGVGISAPQIGVPVQISMIQFTSSQLNFWSDEIQKSKQMEEIPMKIFINPKLHILDKSQVAFTEGCTSMHGFSALGIILKNK